MNQMRVRNGLRLCGLFRIGTLVSLVGAAIAISQSATSEIQRASVDSMGNQVQKGGNAASISANGRFIAFHSNDNTIAYTDAGEASGGMDLDVFVYDRIVGTTTHVSVDSSGNGGNDRSGDPSVSGNGRYVAFDSFSTNLVPNDTNDKRDVFVHDRWDGTTTRVSIDNLGNQLNTYSHGAHISDDGRYVAYERNANLVVFGEATTDLFVHDRDTGLAERVNIDNSGQTLTVYNEDEGIDISVDGRYVTFISIVEDPQSGLASTRVYRRDRTAGITTLVSVNSSGIPADASAGLASMSADGRFVAFVSNATNLAPASQHTGPFVYVHDTVTGLTTQTLPSDGNSQLPAINANGRFVAVSSLREDLVVGDTNGFQDIFVYDRKTGYISSSTAGFDSDITSSQTNPYSNQPSISGNGEFVAFTSTFTNLIPDDTNNAADVYVSEVPCTKSRLLYDPSCVADEPSVSEIEWVIVGCEWADCCPGCPENFVIDWKIYARGDPTDWVTLSFENLSEQTIRNLRLDGEARWLQDQRLQVRCNQELMLSGFPISDRRLLIHRNEAPRMQIDGVTRGRQQSSARRNGTIRVDVEQMVETTVINRSSVAHR